MYRKLNKDMRQEVGGQRNNIYTHKYHKNKNIYARHFIYEIYTTICYTRKLIYTYKSYTTWDEQMKTHSICGFLLESAHTPRWHKLEIVKNWSVCVCTCWCICVCVQVQDCES